MTQGRPWLLPAAAAAIGIAIGSAFALHARATNGAASFPLDDAWIHLTYARTLAETGRFAYFPAEPTTQGSTAPAFTILLAAGFRLLRDEKLLGIGLGILSHGAFLAAFAVWARRRLGGGAAWTAAATALVALDSRMAILAASGMETSLFLAAVAAACAFAAHDRPAAAGLASGLAVWIRPEGLILGAVLAIASLIERRRPARLLLPFTAAAAGWAAFNAALGGSLLPNTFAAKTAYYAAESRASFLTHDVLGLFREGAWPAVAPWAVGAMVLAAIAVARRVEPALLAEAGFIAAVVLAYLVALPFAHRFERYLVPVLPAAAIAGLTVLRAVVERVRGRGARVAIGLAAVVLAGLHLAGTVRAAGTYASFCRYHLERHERAGRWIAAHTPADAVIATHDVGAIGFYSRRRIVDLVGVVRPEVVAHLGDPRWLEALLARERVTHVAALRNWIEVANVPAVFVADPRPEILEVFPWIPGRARLVARASSRLVDAAQEALRAGDVAGALASLDRPEVDRGAARGWYARGFALETARRLPEADEAYGRALALDPDADDPRFRLAVVRAAEGRRDEALGLLRPLLDRRPDYPEGEALRRALSAGSAP